MSSNLRDILLQIYAKHGELTPEIVLEEATPQDSPLHDRIEWNQESAARSFRIVQARAIITSVKIVYAEADETDENKEVHAFVHIPVAGERRGYYVPSEVAMANPVTRELVLRAMRRDWLAFKRRWSYMAEFAQMFTILDAEGEEKAS